MKRDVRILEPVLQSGGRSGRIDMMLAKLVKVSGRTDDNHLVLELKRANKRLSQKEYAQIFEYANAVVQNPKFDKTDVSWDFWLIGVETDDGLNQLCHAADRPPRRGQSFFTIASPVTNTSAKNSTWKLRRTSPFLTCRKCI